MARPMRPGRRTRRSRATDHLRYTIRGYGGDNAMILTMHFEEEDDDGWLLEDWFWMNTNPSLVFDVNAYWEILNVD